MQGGRGRPAACRCPPTPPALQNHQPPNRPTRTDRIGVIEAVRRAIAPMTQAATGRAGSQENQIELLAAIGEGTVSLAVVRVGFFLVRNSVSPTIAAGLGGWASETCVVGTCVVGTALGGGVT